MPRRSSRSSRASEATPEAPVAEEMENDGDGGDDEALPILQDSGLTDDQRRQIRRQQRDLNKDLEEKDLKVEEARDRNNDLYKNVRFTREAVLDGENLILIANRAAQNVDKMIKVPRYDADRLVSKLVTKCRGGSGSNSYFDWRALGVEAGVCFNAIPAGVSFLNGPLMDGQPVRVVQRAQRQRRAPEEELAEEKPEDVEGHTKRDADQLSAIEKSMVVLEKTLHKKVDEQYKKNKKRLADHHGGDKEIPQHLKKKLKKQGVEICAMQYLINPKSFTQTVENIFHFSFLIKKGSAGIQFREKPYKSEGVGVLGKQGPVVKYVKEESNRSRTPRQTIASLTMKDWRDLCRAYEVTEGDLPNRSGSKQVKRERQSLSQVATSS